ncbi:carbonic anhydrase [Pseudogulbenkiania ferrooxidans]|uniref:carbonic anhydrase n=1 Tax=Pseudogulbenkiania ferrooxidans 2002 TaxID=279714 RepID=B9Z1R9_9NEIS|nr:carbonic anhydrase [Pseudogulbenkiania ferrooxidans]EEG09364.1 carbonic anhydrase [Pseudogulbenkiania ferrooxidans 2002]
MTRTVSLTARLLAGGLALLIGTAQATESPSIAPQAAPTSVHADEHGHGSELAQVKGAVDAIVNANLRYMQTHAPGYFERFADKQTPRATVITCSDSRVQTAGFAADAVNDLFMVRDIGNQLATAEGSVEYGVRHLHTPLLLIVGHAVCGAVKAASGDYSGIEPAIAKELATINIPKGIDVTDGVLLNVNNQVDAALLKFAGEVESGKLSVIGAFYDFRNDLRQGYGKLVITNINGETDPARIRDLVNSGRFFQLGAAQPS